MNENDHFALVPRPRDALEKADPGTRRVLSSMVTDTLALARKTPPLRILIVFGDKEFSELLGEAVQQRYENIVLDIFQNGDKGWAELLRADPDFLISNLNREGQNGFVMLALLAEKRVKYPILITNFLWDEPTEKHVLQLAGPNLNVTCLPPPFTCQQLYNELSKHLGPGDNLRRQASIETPRGTTTPAEITPRSAVTRPFKIIYHDDVVELSEMVLTAIQQKYENIALDHFQNGDKAWEELLRADPDLLITDLINDDGSSRTAGFGTNAFFGMSGFDLLMLLDQKKVKYPILVTSAMVENGRAPKNTELARKYWPDLNLSFLKKPFSMDQLYEELAKPINMDVRYGNGQRLANDEVEALRWTVEQGYASAVAEQWLRLEEFRLMSAAEHKRHYTDAESMTLLSMLKRVKDPDPD